MHRRSDGDLPGQRHGASCRPRCLVGVAHMRRHNSGVWANETLRSGLMKRQIAGFLAGPNLYLKGRRNLRRLPGSSDYLVYRIHHS